MSPSFGPTRFASASAPPSPPMSPHRDPLDDIYGSAPASPTLMMLDQPRRRDEHNREILSDLPSRQRALDTDAYREGLSNSKGEYVQEGFDEGYALGANIGQRVGYILGALQGIATALGEEDVHTKEVLDLLATARAELAIQELLGSKWVNEEGIWRWEVHGNDEDVTFRVVADQHPVINRWLARTAEMTARWRVKLGAFEQGKDVALNEE
ncbi:hypothetical protein EJ04DRAFT_509589 [Polyplosphaeria fusca]|uniref:Protein YAE1 n=1 Tax=Polyplosphaeria fusca TaxID=682080 RepID=A0A9P4R7U7_9PLEO|nr:hypothetical protein EJ04DRAFT_509589 [Polyplosphaeria fusca]